MSKEELSWNLSELYNKTDDPKIEEDMKKLENVANRFIKDYNLSLLYSFLFISL
jgi:hypothetical protein